MWILYGSGGHVIKTTLSFFADALKEPPPRSGFA
jgi:hypothetical protein